MRLNECIGQLSKPSVQSGAVSFSNKVRIIKTFVGADQLTFEAELEAKGL